jgi:hypothetical protein
MQKIVFGGIPIFWGDDQIKIFEILKPKKSPHADLLRSWTFGWNMCNGVEIYTEQTRTHTVLYVCYIKLDAYTRKYLITT